jgi:hypothetical protein
MSIATRTGAIAALLVVTASLLSGCPGDAAAPDAGLPQQDCTGFSSPDPCDNDRVCVGGFCDKATDNDDIIADDDPLGCCQRILCLTNDDCADNEKCDVRRGICVPRNLCDPAADNGGPCTQDDGSLADCCQAGQLCEYTDGSPACVDEAAVGQASTCFIAAGGRPVAVAAGDPDAFPAVTRAGNDVQLEVVGMDDTGNVIGHATFTWSGANADGVLVAPACAAGICDVTVTATSVNGSATCNGLVKVYAAPTGDRIVVLDIGTGAPLAGIDVAASAGGVVTAATTDDDGAHEFDDATDSISAFPATHQWHTVLNPPNDVLIFTSKLQNNERVAGIKGTFDFDSVHTQGDIKLGLSGTAIASSITDLNFEALIGDTADYRVELEGITDPGGQVVPLPSGIVINLGERPIKGEYVTFGEPGPNIAWAIGGQVPLAEVGPIISGVAAGDGDVNIGAILGGVLPFFARFDHAVVTGLNLVEVDRPPEPADDEPVPFADWAFETQVITPNTLLALSAAYTMPDLPCAPGAVDGASCTVCPATPEETPCGWTTGAVLLSGVIVPGIGLIPLGLTAGLDDPDDQDTNDLADGKLDYDGENTPGKGEAVIDYAPPHDGLEGNTYVSIAIALDLNAIGDSGGGFGASIITHIARKFEDDNEFPQSFLQAQGGVFVAGSAASFTLASNGDAEFWRVNMSDGEDVEWNVWFDDDAATFNIADLHPVPEAAAARTVDADVQGFVLGSGYETFHAAPTGFTDLFAFDGKDIDNLIYYLGAWSSEACKVDGVCTAQ